MGSTVFLLGVPVNSTTELSSYQEPRRPSGGRPKGSKAVHLGRLKFSLVRGPIFTIARVHPFAF